MYQFTAHKGSRRLAAIAPLLLAAGELFAGGLTIGEAGRIALENDYRLKALQARSLSMAELAVATGELPDPQLKLGFANLPTDTFNLGQEPMTQTVIGVRQMFPRGRTRALSGERISESAARLDAEAEDRKLQILLSVRESYVRVFLQRERATVLQRSRLVFTDLAEITREYYATGRVNQQDVVQAQLELSRLEERLAVTRQQQQEARARLAEWIGEDARRELEPDWPALAEPLDEQRIIERLYEHPRLRAWQHEIARARTSEDLARQAYKPGFAVDLSYGGRGGRNPNGTDRADLLSLFVTMDIPLFTKNRQDRVLASNIADTTATQFVRDDIHRSMKAEVEQHAATLVRERERLGLYTEYLLPQAAFNADTAFEDYRDAVGDLTTLMRARIGEYELELSHAALRADEFATHARLLYLQGEEP